jgi:hypothetical protein
MYIQNLSERETIPSFTSSLCGHFPRLTAKRSETVLLVLGRITRFLF